MTNRSRMPVQTLDKARRSLKRAHKQFGTWRAVGKHFGIPAGTACSVAKGRDPQTPAIRKALGLPVLHLAPACPACGVVHVSKRCPAKRKTKGSGKRVPKWQPVEWMRTDDAMNVHEIQPIVIRQSISPFYKGIRFAVRKGERFCLNVDGEWEFEPIPSSRTDEFYERCRFKSRKAAMAAVARVMG